MDKITIAIVTALAYLNNDALQDDYNALKSALEKKIGNSSDLIDAVNKLEKKSHSKARKALLEEEVKIANVNDDPDLTQLAQNLLDKTPEKFSQQQIISQIFDRYSLFWYVLLILFLTFLATLLFTVFYIQKNQSTLQNLLPFQTKIAQSGVELKSGYEKKPGTGTICELDKGLTVKVEKELEEGKKYFYWVRVLTEDLEEGNNKNNKCLEKINHKKSQDIWGYIEDQKSFTEQRIEITPTQKKAPKIMYKIKTRDKDGVSVRKSVPVINYLGYFLGPEICAIGDGSTVEIIDKQRTTNNELWHQIKSKKLVDSRNCPSSIKGGWIIGEFPDGRKTTIETSEEPKDKKSEEPKDKKSEEPKDKKSDSAPASLNMFDDLKDIKDEKWLFKGFILVINSTSFKMNISMAIGVMFALIIYLYTQKQPLKITDNYFKYILLFLISFVIMILFDSYEKTWSDFTSSEGKTVLGSLIYDLNRLFFNHPLFLANMAGGFVLSMLLLKFISFANKK